MPDKPRLTIAIEGGVVTSILTNVPGLTVVHEIDHDTDVSNLTDELLDDHEDPEDAHKEAVRLIEERNKRLSEGLTAIEYIKVYNDPD